MGKSKAQSLEDLRRNVEISRRQQDRGCKSMPTDEEIRSRCLEIQKRWLPEEELKRRVTAPQEAMLRVIHRSDL
jgi:hypothetical protein